MLEISVGKKHFLFTPEEPEGAKCAFIDGILCMSVFMAHPTIKELHPIKIRLGLQVYHRAVFLVVNFAGAYFDMPFIDQPMITAHAGYAAIKAGMGLDANFCICDNLGIVRSMAARIMTNTFSNAFIDAANEQVRNNYTQAQHELAVQGAYALWSNPQKMFEATSVREEGWTTI